jgi:hypothetical protein
MYSKKNSITKNTFKKQHIGKCNLKIICHCHNAILQSMHVLVVSYFVNFSLSGLNGMNKDDGWS